MTSRPMPPRAMTRRSFVAAGVSSAFFPGLASAQANRPTNPDVVIIGAGAAGIAAAHVLAASGVSYVHVEAAPAVGGRAVTETTTFGVPFDHGAHWVQNQQRNPYFGRAQVGAGRFYKAPENYSFYNSDGPSDGAAQGEFWAAVEQVQTAIATAGKRNQDVAPASVAPIDMPWAHTAWFYTGPWIMGKDMDQFSCADWWNSAGSVDWYHADGYGQLVRNHAAALPVSLNTPVSKIKWGGDRVAVETSNGTINAKAVIVTVSTGVLASGDIAFDPPLTVEKQEAFQGISMGYYNHIALHFSQDIFGMGEDGYVFHKVNDSYEAFGALTNASGSGLAYCDTGGSFARELEQAGEAAAIDFVKGTLRNMIGADVDRYLIGAAATEWGKNPYVQGCYASAEPGAFALRDVLRAPVGERVFFAGEACHKDLWATVGGADLSGTETATTVARIVLKDG